MERNGGRNVFEGVTAYLTALSEQNMIPTPFMLILSHRWFRRLSVVAVCFLWTSALRAAELEVMAKTPYGRTESKGASEAITATFNQPMVPLDAPASMADFCPFHIEPSIPGRCRWEGTQMLRFEPKGLLTDGTLYHVTIPGGTASKVSKARLSADVTWDFETQRPQVITSKPTDNDGWIALKPEIFVQFNLAMDWKKARPFVTLEEGELDAAKPTDTIALSVRRAKAGEIKKVWNDGYDYSQVAPSTANVLVFIPSRALKPDHSYHLKLAAGLPAAKGMLGSLNDYVISFETWYTFHAKSFPEKKCLPDNLEMAFSNPVRLHDLYEHMHVQPSTTIPAAQPYQADQTGLRDRSNRQVTFVMPAIDYQPDSQYRFTVDKNLKDIFGNVLGQDVVFTMETDGYCPYVDMPQGFGILESYLPPRHPLTLLNVPKTTVLMTPISDDQVIPLFRNRDNWTNDGNVALDHTLTRLWTSKARRNIRSRGCLDFHKWLGKDGGFVFSQVKSVESTDLWYKALDNITRLGITFKSSTDSTLFWTSFLKTGSPAPNTPVEIRNDDNAVLWRGVTDSNGFAVGPGWKKMGIHWRRYTVPKLWAFAQDAKGSAALYTEWKEGIEPYRFNLNYDGWPREALYQGTLFSDRGIYRPGETVNLKGILRKLNQGGWISSDKHRLRLILKDARSNEVLRTTVTVSVASSFDYSYALNGAAPTGFWTALVTDITQENAATVRPVAEDEEGEDRSYEGTESAIHLETSFRVEAFKPASFEVHVVPEKSSYLVGDTYKASIDGWYLFGAPMAEATVKWTLRMTPTSYAPAGFEDFDFSGGWWESSPQDELQSDSDELPLDSKGKAAVEVAVDTATNGTPLSAVLEASVMSPDRQRLFGRASVTIHPADLYVGLRSTTSFVDVGHPIEIDVVSLRPDGRRAAGRPITVTIVRHDYLSVERAGVAGRLEWESEERNTTVSTFTFVSAVDTHTLSFQVDQPGQYFVSASGEDEAHRATKSAIAFYAIGKGDSWWERNDTDIIELIPDKKTYKPGDVAHILVKSPYASTRAMVTVEREGILNHRLTVLNGNAAMIDVPIDENYLPNVYVGVMLVQGRTGLDHYSAEGDDLAKPQAKFGYVNLSVDPGGRRLKVHVSTDKTDYRPRQTVTVTLKTLDEKGMPVSSEVTLYAVDEGVLSLTGYVTPDPFDSFYGERPLSVEMVDSRQHIIGQRSFGEKGENRGGGGGSRSSLEGVDLRSRFAPTPYWNPKIMTDAAGNAQTTFALPDNLSRFRIMAVAATNVRFGSGESKLTVSKPLLLRSSLPRLARLGDRFDGGMVVHNYTGHDVQVLTELVVSGDGVKVDGERERSVLVAAGKAVEVLWSCHAVNLGKTSFQFRARAGDETDGLEWTVPVLPAEHLETVATSGVTENESVESLARAKNAVANVGGVELSLSPSAMAGLQEGARYLLEYPYGCLEQRLSRSLPVIVGADLVAQFGLGSMGNLKGEVQHTLDTLGSFQHPSGGLGYWPNPWQPDPYVTAYALDVSTLAAKAGYTLPMPVIHRAVAWLKIYLASRQNWAYPYSESEDYAARAYVLYVLGLYGQSPANYFMELYQRRDQLPYMAKAYLAKAAPLMTRDPAIQKTLEGELLNQGKTAPTTLHFEEPAETRMPWVHESSVMTTSIVLQTLLETQGGFTNDEKVIRWLIGERKDQGRWRTTLENAGSLRAFQDFYKRYEKDVPNFTAGVNVDRDGRPQPLWQEVFHGRSLVNRTKQLSLADVFGSADQTRLSFKKEGTGRLYYTMRMQYAPSSHDKPEFEGFEIEKSVKPLYGKSKILQAGARAVVTLTIRTKQDRTFVAINDPLPGGFEIVDPTFETEGHDDARVMERSTDRAPYWGDFERSENYDDRILIFSDFLSAGEHKYSYLVQATTPGEFAEPATYIEQMYEPEVFAHTASGHVDIKK